MEIPSTGVGRERRRKQQLELFVSSVEDYAIFLLDVDGHVLTWNPGAERIKGYTAEEIVGQHFRRFYPAEARARLHPEEELEVAAREGRFEEEGWRVRRDGSMFWANVVITAIRDETGALTGYGKVTRDLTNRRAQEERLRAANGELVQFRRLVESVQDYAIFMLDPKGHVTTWNSGARRIKGYADHEILGRHFSAFYPEDERNPERIAERLRIATREGRFEQEGWRVRKDGTRFWCHVTITPVRDDDGTLLGFAKVTRDLTTQRAAEEELLHAQRELAQSNAELDQFAAVAAHDLRQPLVTVAGFVDLLARREGKRLSPEGREMLRYVTSAAGGMLALIDNLLAYASLGEPAPAAQRVDLRDAVANVATGLQSEIEARGAVLEVEIAPRAAVLGDAMAVHALVQNLVSNAVKYGSAEGPRVTIRVEATDDRWRLVVADNGPGIDPVDQARIFDAFQRLPESGDRSGNGLGLAICARAVQRLGGEVGVDSTPGAGSQFWALLPAAPAS